MQLVNLDVINNIYSMQLLYAKNENRYANFDSFLVYNNKNWKWEKKDFPRIISLLEFNRLVQKHKISSINGLSFNGKDDPEWEYISRTNITDFKFDKHTGKNDLHTWNCDNKLFDFCLLNQTLEHLYNPILCLQNIYEHMRSDSYLWINVPVINIPHEIPQHYYTGYTPVGLGCVCYAAGFEPLEIGYWGNKEYMDKMFDMGWVDYSAMSLPLLNELKYAVITWGLFKK